MTDLALVAGEVVGWRAWRLKPWRLKPLCADPPVSLLYGVTQMSYTPWPADRTMTAVCTRSLTTFAAYRAGRDTIHDEAAPVVDCTCGVYARATPARVMREYQGQAVMGEAVIGRVRLWGRVIEHEDGYRAEHARVGMILPLWPAEMDDRMRALAARYGATVDDTEAERLVAEHAPQLFGVGTVAVTISAATYQMTAALAKITEAGYGQLLAGGDDP